MIGSTNAVIVSGGSSPYPVFGYTGDYQMIDDGDGNWRIKFLTSGNLSFWESPGSCDVFLVGGGGSGAFRSLLGDSPNENYGSGGGGGGYTATHSSLALSSGTIYPIVIGSGGNAVSTTGSTAFGNDGSATSAFGYSANGGKGGGVDTAEYLYQPYRGGNGGSGGGGGDRRYANDTDYMGGSNGGNGYDSSTTAYGIGQGTTTREFGENDGDLYAGGGGAGVFVKSNAYDSYDPPVSYDNNGGSGGGGNGCLTYAYSSEYWPILETEPSDGTTNSGGGGGGGLKARDVPNGEITEYPSGAGGSGIVILRNHRGA